jgi:acyl carrier protein
MRLRWPTLGKYANRTAIGLGGTWRAGARGNKYPPLIGADRRPPPTTRPQDSVNWVALQDEVGTMSDIADRVKKIVVDNLGVDPDKVTENASFIEDLGADSLDTVELVMAFEEEFNCEIPDDTAETILTVGDAIKFLEKNAKG